MAPTNNYGSPTANVDTNAGHVFGRLGQGELTMPGKSAPFLWFK